MTRILRHQGFDREDDGAMDWNTLLPLLCRDSENASEWTKLEWLDLLRTGSDKERFQYCVNSDGFIHHMRAIPSKVTLEQTRLIHHCWITYKFRTDGVSTFITSVLLSKLIPLSIQDCSQAVDPLSNWQVEEYQDLSKPRKVRYRNKWKEFQDAISWINLRKAQDTGF